MKTEERFFAPIVHNMLGQTGKPVVNHFVITMPEGSLFQSYNFRICYYDIVENKLYFGTKWNYSRTTSKYLVKFLQVYASKWYARIMSYGKRTLSANIQQAIIDGAVTFVTNW